jgi:hypothetical protein
MVSPANVQVCYASPGVKHIDAKMLAIQTHTNFK